MTVYQKCLFCDRVFTIGPEDYESMQRHMSFAHSEPERRPKAAETYQREHDHLSALVG